MNEHRYAAVVAVPTFNASGTIGGTLRSIVESMRFYVSRHGGADRMAVSVVDDASTDDTPALVRAFAGTSPFEIILTALDENGGRGKARNLAVSTAHSETYLFLDHDDEYLPPHIAVCLEALAADPRAGFVKTGVHLSTPVHPDWEPRIADCLTHNLCVRAWCHRIVGGFHEEPEVEAYGCDDILYNRTLGSCIRGVHVPDKTVTFWRRPGNSFDRQFDRKFARPEEEGEVTLSERQLQVRPRVLEIHAERLSRVKARMSRLSSIQRGATRAATLPNASKLAEIAILRGACQKMRELTPLVALLKRRRLRAVLEIGTLRGGTLWLWCQLTVPDGVIVSVDLPGGPFGGGLERLAQPAQTLHLIRSDSHAPRTRDDVAHRLGGRSLDLLFLDGDHRYEGVRSDFEMYAPLVRDGGLVVFHDILPHPNVPLCGVHRFWDEIKHGYDFREFLEPDDDRGWGQWGGIGVVTLPRSRPAHERAFPSP